MLRRYFEWVARISMRRSLKRLDYLNELNEVATSLREHDIDACNAIKECARIAKKYNKFKTTVLEDLRDII